MKAKTLIKTNSKTTAWGIDLIAFDLILDGGDTKPRLSAGGTCGNVMAILSRLGWNAVPVARLASGGVSNLVMGDLQRWNVDTSRLQLRPTARVPIIVQRIRRMQTESLFTRFRSAARIVASVCQVFRLSGLT